jgi:lysophospholipase L1-like esterase
MPKKNKRPLKVFCSFLLNKKINMNLQREKSFVVFITILCMSFCTFQGMGQKLKIMPLGNSITYGEDSMPKPDSRKVAYRWKLYQLLTAAGYTFDFVGSEKSGSDSLPTSIVDSLNYTDNAGLSGATTANLINVLNTGWDPFNGSHCLITGCPAEYLPVFDPDVILLHIGTNDLSVPLPGETVRNNVETVLDIIDDYEASAGKTIPVFLAQIINRMSGSGDPEHGPTIVYNDLLGDLVDSRPSDEIILVDMENGAGINYKKVTYGGDMVDTWHPGPTGYAKMAIKWFQALEGYNLRPPTVYDIPDDTIYEDESNIIIDLNNYVFDPQEADVDITWSYTPYPSAHFNISIVSGIATISLKNAEWSGSETLTFKAQDSGNGSTPLFDTDVVTLYSVSVNDPPVILDRGPFYVNEDSQIQITLDSLEVNDPDNIYPDDFTLHIQPGSNYTIIPTNIVKPNANYNGSLTVPMYVNDGLANSPLKNMTVIAANVNDYPWINLPSVRSVNEDSQYSRTITAGDVDTGDDLILSGLPPFPGWLTFNTQTGQLSGLPDNYDVGNHTVKIRVFDGTVNVDSTFIIKVINTNDLPVFTSYPEDTVVGTYEEFIYNITAIDIDPTNDLLVYAVIEKPDWLEYDPITRRLSGTPDNEDVGVYHVEISVFDGTGYTYQNFNLTVELTNHPPEIISTPKDTAYETIEYKYVIKAMDIDFDMLTYSSVIIPDWTTFSASGTLKGIPGNDDLGVHEVVLSVSDGENIVYDSFNITVVKTNYKPIILGTTKPLNTPKETPLPLSLDDLEVEDTDNIYPDDFTLKIEPGNNYTPIDNTVVPNTGFLGYLKVGIKVNDGIDDSDLAEIDVGVGTTSIANHPLEKSILGMVYPNPASDYVYFMFENNSDQAVLSFFDSSVNLVKKVIIPEGTGEQRINLFEFPAGIVFYKIDYQNNYYLGKLIKL